MDCNGGLKKGNADTWYDTGEPCGLVLRRSPGTGPGLCKAAHRFTGSAEQGGLGLEAGPWATGSP